MATLRKGDILAYLDIGLFGTFVDFIEDGVEEGYVKIKYVPFDTWRKKVHIFERSIKKEHIRHVITTKSAPGIEERIIYIYTGEEGSLMKTMFDDEKIQRIKSLQDEIKGLKKEIASSRQQATDARSGVSKTIEQLNTLNKRTNNDPFGPPSSSYGLSRTMPTFDNNEGDY